MKAIKFIYIQHTSVSVRVRRISFYEVEYLISGTKLQFYIPERINIQFSNPTVIITYLKGTILQTIQRIKYLIPFPIAIETTLV